MTQPTKPSNDWVARLILLIQESPTETGKSFGEFMEHYENGLYVFKSDDSIIKSLKEML